MIAGHIPAAYCAGRLVYGRSPCPLTLFVLAYLPDLLDKNLYYVLGLTSRGYFHSLPLAGCLCLIIYGVCVAAKVKEPGSIARKLFFFYCLHLLCDWMDPQVLMWPLRLHSGVLRLEPGVLEAGAFDFSAILRRFYVERVYPVWLGAEVFCFALALVILARDWLVVLHGGSDRARAQGREQAGQA